MRVALAPDPAVPQRDELLDERRLAALLGAERVELVRVKYRVGRGVGLVLRVHVAGRTHRHAGNQRGRVDGAPDAAP